MRAVAKIHELGSLRLPVCRFPLPYLCTPCHVLNVLKAPTLLTRPESYKQAMLLYEPFTAVLLSMDCYYVFT